MSWEGHEEMGRGAIFANYDDARAGGKLNDVGLYALKHAGADDKVSPLRPSLFLVQITMFSWCTTKPVGFFCCQRSNCVPLWLSVV